MDQEFDTDRQGRNIVELQGKTTQISHFGSVTLRVDETGHTIQLPVRMTHSERLGIALELGPYSLSTQDATVLHILLAEYLARADWAGGQ